MISSSSLYNHARSCSTDCAACQTDEELTGFSSIDEMTTRYLSDDKLATSSEIKDCQNSHAAPVVRSPPTRTTHSHPAPPAPPNGRLAFSPRPRVPPGHLQFRGYSWKSRKGCGLGSDGGGVSRDIVLSERPFEPRSGASGHRVIGGFHRPD